MPSLVVQHELLRCFFEHVWPLLPVVDLRDFLTTYLHDPAAVSRLLLWSVFFAAANASRITIGFQAPMLTVVVRRSRGAESTQLAIEEVAEGAMLPECKGVPSSCNLVMSGGANS